MNAVRAKTDKIFIFFLKTTQVQGHRIYGSVPLRVIVLKCYWSRYSMMDRHIVGHSKLLKSDAAFHAEFLKAVPVPNSNTLMSIYFAVRACLCVYVWLDALHTRLSSLGNSRGDDESCMSRSSRHTPCHKSPCLSVCVRESVRRRRQSTSEVVTLRYHRDDCSLQAACEGLRRTSEADRNSDLVTFC